MKNKIIFTLFMCLPFIFCSCSKDDSYEAGSENAIPLELSDSSPDNLITEPQKWHITQKRICVVFGYDFNEENEINEILDILQDRYGLAKDGGLIYPLTFPDDFKSGGRSYYNNFRLILQNDIENLAGVIILGAPERTHDALARNQDFWNMNVPYPVVALFPQDDILGLESTCDIVIDKGQNANFNGEILGEDSPGISIPEASDILVQTINYIATLDGTLEKDKSLASNVLYMLKNRQIHHYTDPETGLQSVNHFVIN